MTVTFPRTGILEGLCFRVDTPHMRPLWRQETSRTAGGATLVKNMGPLLWQASYSTTAMSHEAAGNLEADLLTLENGGQLFEGYDPRRRKPVAYTIGSLASVTVHSIRADRLALRLTGLPAGMVLSKNDWLSIDDGTNLHLLRVVETVTTAGTGLSPWFEVRPGIRPSIAVATPVVLTDAPGRFMVDPGSVERTPTGGLHDTVSWTATQVIE